MGSLGSFTLIMHDSALSRGNRIDGQDKLEVLKVDISLHALIRGPSTTETTGKTKLCARQKKSNVK